MSNFGKSMIIIGVILLAAIVAYPVFAHRDGWGWGHGYHMRGYGGQQPGYYMHYDRGYGNLTEGQIAKLQELDRKFYTENEKIRNDIWAKSTELNTLLNAQDPDVKKAKALQSEINDLRDKLSQNRLEYELEAQKIAPDIRYGNRWGRGGCCY
jgi:zinc resistance-associated protein